MKLEDFFKKQGYILPPTSDLTDIQHNAIQNFKRSNFKLSELKKDTEATEEEIEAQSEKVNEAAKKMLELFDKEVDNNPPGDPPPSPKEGGSLLGWLAFGIVAGLGIAVGIKVTKKA